MIERDPAHDDIVQGAVPFDPSRVERPDQAESPAEAHDLEGNEGEWTYWQTQIDAAEAFERRFRAEARDAERLWFGDEEDVGEDDGPRGSATKPHGDRVNLVHANIATLQPLIYSSPPIPMIRARFVESSRRETYRMAAELAERVAVWIVDTTDLDAVARDARDDWLVPGRGAAVARYRAEIVTEQAVDPATGALVEIERKADEEVYPVHVHWTKLLFAPATSWERTPWLAMMHHLERTEIAEQFGKDIAQAMSYPLSLGSAKRSDSEIWAPPSEDDEATSATGQCRVWEIWDRRRRRVVWWSPDLRHAVLREESDPLGLRRFFPVPRPLLAATRTGSLTPRPDISYYKKRAEEVNTAAEKLASILETISISGVFAGQEGDTIRRILSGKNQLVAVKDWMAFAERGGIRGMIDWLPIEQMVQAINALLTLRESAKNELWEVSGISDILRGQGNPNETATAQRIKGRYAGLRLEDRQRLFAVWLRDLLALLLELALEHFDTERLAQIAQLDGPTTEAERAQIVAQAQAEHALAVQEWQAAAAQAALAAQAGQDVGPPPPPPEPPDVPKWSVELLHDLLRNDLTRAFAIQIETDSTVVGEDEAEKQARVEFVTAVAGMAQNLLATAGFLGLGMVKELLLFGVRGFRQARTLEAMIEALPDEAPAQEQREEASVMVAKIREMAAAERQERDHAHDFEMLAAQREGAERDRVAEAMLRAAEGQ